MTEDYKAFVEKFKPKKTSDDCYTPPLVYEAVKDWACAEYGIDPASIIRPFYPGGDYQKEDYAGKVVVDNPPFSILMSICKWYQERGIKFFLFAEGRTILNKGRYDGISVILIGTSLTYENGAGIHTGFVTNMEEAKIRISGELSRLIGEAVKKNGLQKQKPPKYQYPPEVFTFSRDRCAKYLEKDLKIMPDECRSIRQLDAQKERAKTIYGNGFLLGKDAAERVAAAIKNADAAKMEMDAGKMETGEAATMVWALSERERALCSELK